MYLTRKQYKVLKFLFLNRPWQLMVFNDISPDSLTKAKLDMKSYWQLHMLGCVSHQAAGDNRIHLMTLTASGLEAYTEYRNRYWVFVKYVGLGTLMAVIAGAATGLFTWLFSCA